jgi:hypothetical protein
VINPFEYDKTFFLKKSEEEFNIYKSDCVDEMLDDDELTSQEAAFMEGYLS